MKNYIMLLLLCVSCNKAQTMDDSANGPQKIQGVGRPACRSINLDDLPLPGVQEFEQGEDEFVLPESPTGTGEGSNG